MEVLPEAKSARLLEIFARLSGGETISRAALAQKYHVSLRSIQRDMESLRCFLAEQRMPQEIVYSKREGGYRMILHDPDRLTNDEILAVCKILLESRSLRRDEMQPILDKLIRYAVPEENQRAVRDLIGNEAFHYVPPHHGKKLLDRLWDIGQAVQEQRVMVIRYERMKEPKLVERRVQPVGLMFSEYYFYLTAFLEDKTHFDNPDDIFPTIYRVDRIREFQVLDEHFQVPYLKRFEEGEFRKRVQFMYGGRLRRVRFRYTGPSVEAVLDRLPTAAILSEDSEGWTVEAEVFGSGVEMWLRSQGGNVSVLEEQDGKAGNSIPSADLKQITES